MKVSVEISTYNRQDILQSVLERLALQDYPFDQFEVIISDDGSIDKTSVIVESLKKKLPYKIIYIQHAHCGSGPTHNIGIQQASGDIIIMMADDILAQPQLISEHMKTHAAHPELSVVVVGKLMQSPNLPDTIFQKSWNSIANELFSDNIKDLNHGGFFVSNMSFKRKFLLACGLFRNWPAGAHEDLELSFRLRQKGMTLIFNKMALGYHHHPETIDSVAARSYMHGYNWHFIENNFPELWIRLRSGNISMHDGMGLYWQVFLKKVLRLLLINRFTIKVIAIPIIKRAEEKTLLAPIVPFFIGKMASYHFHRGIRDSKRKQVIPEIQRDL